jgi:hypothetical protein
MLDQGFQPNGYTMSALLRCAGFAQPARPELAREWFVRFGPGLTAVNDHVARALRGALPRASEADELIRQARHCVPSVSAASLPPGSFATSHRGYGGGGGGCSGGARMNARSASVSGSSRAGVHQLRRSDGDTNWRRGRGGGAGGGSHRITHTTNHGSKNAAPAPLVRAVTSRSSHWDCTRGVGAALAAGKSAGGHAWGRVAG